MAGLAGIQAGIDPTEAGFWTNFDNIFDWSEERRATIKSLPTSVEAAMSALENGAAFLTEHGIFDETLIRTWVNAKRKEANQVNQRPSPFEIENYYDC